MRTGRPLSRDFAVAPPMMEGDYLIDSLGVGIPTTAVWKSFQHSDGKQVPRESVREKSHFKDIRFPHVEKSRFD